MVVRSPQIAASEGEIRLEGNRESASHPGVRDMSLHELLIFGLAVVFLQGSHYALWPTRSLKPATATSAFP